MKLLLDMLRSQIRAVRYRWWVLVHDLLMIPVAWLGAYWLRYNLNPIPDIFLTQAENFLYFVVPIQGAALQMFGVHRVGQHRIGSIRDLSQDVGGQGVATVGPIDQEGGGSDVGFVEALVDA